MKKFIHSAIAIISIIFGLTILYYATLPPNPYKAVVVIFGLLFLFSGVAYLIQVITDPYP